ncbi:MAG: T9SS type A sorting domain-containing protein [Pseudobacter sp.]|uniref:T9SS type A sorting domain-containing protein n=1 Tax=Pseudobacter sp. TaxID=2045420 RepID=UPI003F81EFB8
MKHLYSSGILLLLLLVSAITKAQIRYATGVVNFSSQYSTTGWSAEQTLGAPNTVGCGDVSTSWASASSDGRREFLELSFDNPAPVNRIFIYETLSPGAIDTVYVFNPNTQAYEKVYEATAAASTLCPQVFTINFALTSFPVDRIRIAINSPAVAGYNEIDAAAIANYSSEGIIDGNQNVCASAAGRSFTSLNPAFDGAPGVVYQWQDSTVNGSWKDIASAAALTYQPPVVTENTWYRRKATLTGTTVYSNVLKLTFIESGDPALIPQDSWNFYAYESPSLDLGAAVYKGYYSRAVLNFNSMTDWGSTATPTAASGYQGCVVPDNKFVLVAKRKGFPAGNYNVITSFSAAMRIYVNGSLISQPACCYAVVSLGRLDNNSTVEIRMLDNNSNAYLTADFQIAELNGGTIGDPQALCVNEAPAAFQSTAAASGGAAPSSITYQWQDSVVTGIWRDIPAATVATYQGGVLSDTTWYRRKATDNSGAFAYSNIIRVSVATQKGDSAIYGNQQWNVYGFNGNDITLATGNYRGFYQATGMQIDSHLHFGVFGSPSDAAGYMGCPVNNENFIMSARRTNFPAGRYRLDISNVDDEIMVLVDGVQKYRGGCCLNLDLGVLNATSKLDIRLREGGYITRLITDLVRIDSSIAEYQNTNCNFYQQSAVSGDNWFDLTDASGKIIASVNPGTNNLGTFYLYAKHYGPGIANIPKSSVTKKKYMPRYFRFMSSNYSGISFPSPVKLRLYFKNSELDDYKTSTNDPLLSRTGLQIAHYKGGGEDCELFNNTGEGTLIMQSGAKDFTTEGFYLEFSTNSFSEFGVLDAAQVLPVKLTSFRAEAVNNTVKLSWATSQEIDNKGFEIQRSTDGKNFVKIGWVDGNGTTSTPMQYTFTDISPAAGKNFYRLSQQDINGNVSYSDIVAASTKKAMKLNLSPNPVENILYVEFDEKNTTSLKIMDMQGRVVWRKEGLNTSSVLSIPVQILKRGIYVLEATDRQGNRQVERFIRK